MSNDVFLLYEVNSDMLKPYDDISFFLNKALNFEEIFYHERAIHLVFVKFILLMMKR
ncbi:hypothetical protein KU06062604_1040001 [Flavobacterium psychrophilum]|nr:hypothetical protein KU06062604_1040001 [Flavobacterium psychrophilum]